MQAAAADALAEMSGITDNGRSAARWQQWFAANAGRSRAEWKAAIYPGRVARLEDAAQRYSRLSADLSSILTEQYQAAPTVKEKSAAVMRYLNSPEADIRLVGARIVRDAFLAAQSLAQPVQDRLKDLIGDSDPRVRLEVAKTLRATNAPGTIDLLLTQLSQEQDSDVKVELIGALAQTGELRSVAVLRKLAHDENARVATAAIEAVRAAWSRPLQD